MIQKLAFNSKSTFNMKKAKIMLLSSSVLAIVGATLAFKAQKIGVAKYCYSITNICPPPDGDCTLTIINASALPYTGEEKICYTTTNDARKEACALVTCPNEASLFGQ